MWFTQSYRSIILESSIPPSVPPIAKTDCCELVLTQIKQCPSRGLRIETKWVQVFRETMYCPKLFTLCFTLNPPEAKIELPSGWHASAGRRRGGSMGYRSSVTTSYCCSTLRRNEWLLTYPVPPHTNIAFEEGSTTKDEKAGMKRGRIVLELMHWGN